jgi:hypothetical protein
VALLGGGTALLEEKVFFSDISTFGRGSGELEPRLCDVYLLVRLSLASSTIPTPEISVLALRNQRISGPISPQTVQKSAILTVFSLGRGGER